MSRQIVKQKEKKKHAHAQARTRGEAEQSSPHPKQREDLLQQCVPEIGAVQSVGELRKTKLLPLTRLRAAVAAAAAALSQSLSDTSAVIYPPLRWWRRQLSALPRTAVWRQIEGSTFARHLKACAVCVVHFANVNTACSRRRGWVGTQTRLPISWLLALITFLIEMSTCHFNCSTARKGESAHVHANSGDLHLSLNWWYFLYSDACKSNKSFNFLLK